MKDHQFDQIIQEHLPLVKHIAQGVKQTLPANVELDDLIQDGFFGILHAVRSFDPNRGISFKTHARNRIRGAILDGLRRSDWLSRSSRYWAKRSSIAPILINSEGLIALLHDHCPEDGFLVDGFLVNILKKLSLRSRIIMQLRYYHDASFIDIGKVLSLHPETIRQIHNKALGELRKRILECC